MLDSKRVLILTANAGFGHRSAANAIAAALQETHADDCAVEVVNPLDDTRLLPFLSEGSIDHDRLVRQIPDLYKFGYETSDATLPSAIVESAMAVMFFEVMRDVIQRYEPDAIVTTYPLYQAPLDAVRVISRRKIPLLTVVTDLATVHRLWFHKAADLCLVPTPIVRDLALKYGLRAEKVRITGIPVHPAFVREKRPPGQVRRELGWQPDLKTVLAVGSKRIKNLKDVLRALNHSGLPLQLAVVAGGDDDLYAELERMEWHIPVHLFNFVDNMPTLTHAADCLMSKAGGLIVTEALACGLPLLLIDFIPGQEVGNVEYVVNAGAGELAESPLDALEIMFHWLDQGGALLAERAASARDLGHARAAYDIAELAYAATEQAFPRRTGRRLLGSLKFPKLLRGNS